MKVLLEEGEKKNWTGKTCYREFGCSRDWQILHKVQLVRNGGETIASRAREDQATIPHFDKQLRFPVGLRAGAQRNAEWRIKYNFRELRQALRAERSTTVGAV